MVRFVHTADWQLGMARHFLDADAQARFTAARIDAVRRIGALAAAERCDFVIVCGDVFESNHLSRQIVLRSLEAMAAVPVPVFLLPGNHDPLDASSIFRSEPFRTHQPTNVHVLEGGDPVEVGPGVAIVGAPWHSKRPGRDLVAAALADLASDATPGVPSDGTLRILAGHGAVDVLSPDRTDQARIALGPAEAALAEGRIDFVALGDRHSRTDVGASGRVWYPGAPEPTDFDEVDPGLALVVELGPGTCEVNAHEVGTWRFEEHRAALTGTADVERLGLWFEALPAKERTAVRLSLIGTLGLADHAALLELLDHQAQLLASVQRWAKRSDLVVVPSDDDLGRLDLQGFAARTCEELRSAVASGGDDGAVAADALALLHRLASGRAA